MAPEIFGRYQLQELIGRGGMGEVYRAVDTVSRRTVALKRLRPELVTDDRFRARFLRECRLTAQLTEDHVIPIHHFGEIEGRLYLDMRVIEGGDLAAVLAADGPLPPERAVDVVAQVAAALDAAHAAGLVHRDVKPSNVLLAAGADAADAHCYLVDFGVAGAVGHGRGSLTATGTMVGSLDYLAPERLIGARSDRRVDVYSLACLLHEALTGSPPFHGDELPAMIHAHLNLDPPRPSALVEGLPEGLDAVVARGMAKDPAARYPTAGAMAAAARAALAPGAATAATGTAPTMVSRALAAAAAATTAQPPRPGAPAGSQRRARLGSALLTIVLLAVAGAGVALGAFLLHSAPTGAASVTAEPVGSPGEHPFGPTGTGAPRISPATPPGGTVTGDTAGLYGATLSTACDTVSMAMFLQQHPDRAAAWAAAQGIEPARIPQLLEGLTPVTLRADTAVTNHGFADGRATQFQSVLQAGTAVLIDDRGMPRVRCTCGNPLRPPTPRAAARYTGSMWPGFSDRAVTVVAPAPAAIHEFLIVAPTTNEVLARPRATAGEQDHPAAPAATAHVLRMYPPSPPPTSSPPSTAAPNPRQVTPQGTGQRSPSPASDDETGRWGDPDTTATPTT
ncbi:serine/threonine-protein kinase [Pseudonocardia sp. H11422]|uniref:serine/threonine-protein kinase n=1 Tax=Pseudonocardia sp. H11422 TaxID=2835866 RepID=UPI00292DB0DF|nr:serine/threonine-protein kinase [Pseudonocardia sp. H11422]